MPVRASSARAPAWTVTLWCVAALAAAAAVWRATALYGPELDGDGAWTVSAARNLAEGRGLITLTGELYSLWPPLYPALLAVAELAGWDTYQFVRVLHSAALIGVVLLTARMVWAASGSSWLSIAQAAVVASSVHVIKPFVTLASEALFVLLCALALHCAVRLVETDRRRWWWLMALAAAAACLQRYLGIALVLALAIFVVTHARALPLRQRQLRTVGLCAVAAAPLAAWLARNFLHERKWTGGRNTTSQGLGDILSDAVATLRDFSTPAPLGDWLGNVAWLIAFAALATGLIASRWRARTSQRFVEHDACALLTLAYVGVLIALSSRWLVDRVQARLLMPIFPFACAAILIGVHASLASAPPLAARLARWLSVVFVTALIGTNLFVTARTVRGWRSDGAGSFHTRFWMEQPLASWLRENRVDGELHSNCPEMIWRVTGQPAQMLRQSKTLQNKLGQSVSQTGTPCTIAWFRKDGRPVLWLDELGRAARTEIVFEHEQALVLRVEPR